MSLAPPASTETTKPIAPDAPPSALYGDPARRFVVGVTGHRLRHFDAAELPRVRSAVRDAVATISEAFVQVHEAGELRLISSLASGADSMAADAALELGWTIDAILPVHREGYARDFKHAPELVDFERQATAAKALFELPGSDASGANYERAGRVMLDQCDLLLAVWDGRPARGRGGTEQILSEAMERHIPVLLIDAAGERTTEVLWTGFDKHGLKRTQLELIGRERLDALPRLIADLSGDGQPEGPSSGIDVEPGLNVALAFPLLLALMGVRSLRADDFRRPDSLSLRVALRDEYADICTRTGGFGGRLGVLLARYAAADAVATHMAQLYRSGFVANFALAGSAVLLALAGLALPPLAQPILTLSEVAVVAAILWLTHLGRKRGWHARWISERHLAERLRCMVVSAQLGDLNVQLGSALSLSYIGRRLRDAARALGLPTVRVDAGYLGCVRDKLIRLLDDQIAYHRGNAHRMHTLDHRLHRLGTILFSLSALSCIVVLAFEIGRNISHAVALERMAHPLDLAATLASAALPAVGAAIYGIRMQGDFSGIAGRAFELTEALHRLKNAVENEVGGDDGLAFDHLRHSIRQAADLMGSELADWRTAQQARPLTLPG